MSGELVREVETCEEHRARCGFDVSGLVLVLSAATVLFVAAMGLRQALLPRRAAIEVTAPRDPLNMSLQTDGGDVELSSGATTSGTASLTSISGSQENRAIASDVRAIAPERMPMIPATVVHFDPMPGGVEISPR